jgi:hypothetical protein
MEYGKNLQNKWPMLQETAGIAKVLGCTECYGRNGARTGEQEGKNNVVDGLILEASYVYGHSIPCQTLLEMA